MATNISRCARMLADDGVRHHVDREQGVIRVAFVTRHYLNPRGEKLAIVQIDTPDDGHRCRVALPRAFTTGDDPAATCLQLCRLAADTPLVKIECAGIEGTGEELRLVIETVVEDGRLTRLQLLSMVDRLVEAAEAWYLALAAAPTSARRGGRSPGLRRRGAA
jgi:hypothetical protein